MGARLDPARVDVLLAAALLLGVALQAAFVSMPAGDRLVTGGVGGLVAPSAGGGGRVPGGRRVWRPGRAGGDRSVRRAAGRAGDDRLVLRAVRARGVDVAA